MVPPHPDEESMLAYLERRLGRDADLVIEQHLDVCDLCLATLRVSYARLTLANDDGHLAWPATPAIPSQPHHSPALRRFSWTRIPRLAPLSFAAGLVLALALRPWLATPENLIGLRSAQPLPTMHRVQHAAWIYRQPNQASAILATIQAGQSVSIVSGEGDWLQVTLPNGDDGWVERRVIE